MNDRYSKKKFKQNQNISVVVLVIAGIFLVFCSECSMKKEVSGQWGSENMRIISLAPSITETLFALSLGENIVGVTNFCTFPGATKNIEKIGTFTDPNLEKMVFLHPDIVILMKDNGKAKQFLRNHSITYLEIENHSIPQMCHSFLKIGKFFNREKQAQSLVSQFSEIMDTKSSGKNIPKVLICVGRDGPGSGMIRNVFVAGRSTFYSDLIELAGGKNCYEKRLPVYPNMSREGVFAIAPDIIIDIAPAMNSMSCGNLKEDWEELSIVPAVRNNEVYCIAQNYATIPGPRITLLLEDIKDIIRKYRQKFAMKEVILETGS